MDLQDLDARMKALFAGDADRFSAWVRGRTAAQTHAFELASREGDLEALSKFVKSAVSRMQET